MTIAVRPCRNPQGRPLVLAYAGQQFESNQFAGHHLLTRVNEPSKQFDGDGITSQMIHGNRGIDQASRQTEPGKAFVEVAANDINVFGSGEVTLPPRTDASPQRRHSLML